MLSGSKNINLLHHHILRTHADRMRIQTGTITRYYFELSRNMNIKQATFITLSAILGSTAHSQSIDDNDRLICIELGITPEVMAALGMNSVDARTAFDQLDDMDTQLNHLRSLQAQHQSKSDELKAANKQVRHAGSMQEAQEIESQVAQLEADLTTLAVNIETAEDTIRFAMLSPHAQEQTIERVCEPDGMAVFVPVEYRFVTLIQDDYNDLLPALAAERSAEADHSAVDTDTQLVLNRYRNLPTVQSARSNLLYNLDAVKGVFYN